MAFLKGLLGNQYIWFALIVAALWGGYKWEKSKVAAVKTQAAALQKSLTMAEVELQNAEAINKAALDTVASQAREVERQKLIAAAEAKRSRDRAWALAKLQKEINNVPTSQNLPVSDHIESVLDSVRRAVPEPSGSPADSADQGGNGDTAGSAGRDVPATAKPASETPVS